MSRTMRMLRLVIPALAVGLVIAIQSIYFNRGFVPGDAFTYLAAGERLNDGHLLYALSPGDRRVDLHPPYWTVPLLSPPPIAVLFRPLALLPNDLGAYVWWAASTTAIVGAILVMMQRRPVLIGLAVLLLSIPLVYEIGVGNVNALLVAGIVAAWYLLVRGRDVAAGALIATMTVLKLTPVVLAWWLITQRRWGAVRAFLVTGVALGLASLVGAGIPAHFEYLGIVRQTTTTGTSEWSLAGMARFLGVDPTVATVLPPIALVGGIALIWVFRARPGLAYSVAVVTMLFGSPVVQVNWFTLLLAAAAPVVWPVDEDPRTDDAVAAAQPTSRPNGGGTSDGATALAAD